LTKPSRGNTREERSNPAWLGDYLEVSEGIWANVLEEVDVERRWCGDDDYNTKIHECATIGMPRKLTELKIAY
jgi:hypothetical protein